MFSYKQLYSCKQCGQAIPKKPSSQLAKYHQDLDKDKDIFLLLGMMQNAEEAVVR